MAILNQHQVEAIANAWAHLNNVSGYLDVRFSNGRVIEGPNGVMVKAFSMPTEHYRSQADFLAAYGID